MRVAVICDRCGALLRGSLAEEVLCGICAAKHCLPGDMADYLTCPAPDCQMLFLEVPPQDICPDCLSPLWPCPRCQTINLYGSCFCRKCRKSAGAPCGGSQASVDQGGTDLLAVEIQSQRALIPCVDWNPSLQCETPKPIDGLVPAPVAMQDRLVYFNPYTGSFEARSTRAGTKGFGEVLWRSPFYRSDVLPYVSSPVSDESGLLYLVTDSPRYVHRIAVSSGQRQVCRIVLNDEELPEIPGDFLPCSPPIIFELPAEISARADCSKTLALLTTEGLCIFNLYPVSRSPIACLRGHFFHHAEYQEYAWSRPVALGSFIMATSQTRPAILCIDMANYPREVYSEVVPLKMLGDSYSWNSPCTRIQSTSENGGGQVCWYATDDRNMQSKLMIAHSPAFINPIEIPFTGTRYRHLEKGLGPVSDRNVVYVPYYNDRENSIGVTAYEATGRAVHVDVPTPGISPLLAPIAKHELLYAGPSRLYKLDVRALSPALDDCGAYSNTAMEMECCSRPVVTGSHVFIQRPDLIACFELCN